MGEAPDSFDEKTVLRVLGAGIALGALGIGAFVGLWIFLGKTGVADFPRLIASFCLPPAFIAAILGVYMLAMSRRPSNDTPDESSG